MTQHFPVVIERESNGTFSAWIAGLPGVYAAADTAAIAKRAIRGALSAHVETLRRLGREPEPHADIVVLRYDRNHQNRQGRVRFVGLGALMGRMSSPAKREAARRNGRKGGRPRKLTSRAQSTRRDPHGGRPRDDR